MAIRGKTIGVLGILALMGLPGAALAAVAHPQTGIVVGTFNGTAGGTISVTTPGGVKDTIAVGAHTRYAAHSTAAYKAGLKSGEQVVVYTSTTASGTVAATVLYDLKPFGIVTRLVGTISAATTGSLTLATTANPAVAITTTSKTKFTLDRRALKGFTTLPANEPAIITGLSMTTGEVDARFVTLGLPARHLPTYTLNGSISTQGPTVLAITTRSRGTFQVALSPATLYLVDGILVTSPPVITSTEQVAIVASKSGSVYTADSVWVKTH